MTTDSGLRWLGLIGLCALSSWVMAAVGVPSGVLFGSLVAGMVWALASSRALSTPPWLSRAGQGALGVAVGTMLDRAALTSLTGDLPVVLLAVVTTIAVSLGLGQVLRVYAEVSPATAAFASVAGGAAGLIAISHELGADDRIVAVVQYLRVLLVLAALPIVVAWTADPELTSASSRFPNPESSETVLGYAVATAGVMLALFAGRFVPLPGAALLFPLLAGAAVSASGLVTVEVPQPALVAGYLVIGVQVGLRFTRSSLRVVRRIVPLVLLQMATTILCCAGIAVVVSRVAEVPYVDAYLATTPGGLYAGVAAALDVGAQVSFVVSVQVLRLLAATAAAPLLATWFRSRNT